MFPFIASDLKLNVSALGSITAVFVIGEGLFQIPAALMAGRFNQKKVIVLGTLGASFSTLVIAVAGSVVEFELLRFACAVATAFAYAPGYKLITKYFDPGKEGIASGLFGATALTGNIAALLVDSVLPVYIGWRATIALNGVVGLVAALSLITLPRAPYESRINKQETVLKSSPDFISGIRKILFDRRILVVCAVLTSLEVGSVIASNFMIYYLEKQLVIAPAIAGSIASLVPVLGLFASLIFGRLYDRLGNAKLLIVTAGVITAGGLAVAAIGNLFSAGLSSALVGFGNNAGYVISIAVAGMVASKERRFEVVGIAWILSVSLLGSFFAPILFSFLATDYGYPTAWAGSALVMFAMLIPALFVRFEKSE